MSISGLPFDDIRNLVRHMPDRDENASGLAKIRNGELESLFGPNEKQAHFNEWLAAYSGKSPAVIRPMLALFAGTHKIADHFEGELGEETLETVTRLAAGGAPANQVCAANDIGLKVFDLALQYPVEDVSKGEALDEKGAAATIGFGMEAIAGGVDVLGLAAFGHGSEIANAALLGMLLDQKPETFLGRLPADLQSKAIKLAEAASERHGAAKADPLELLRRLGGREHSAIAGAILAARTNHVPVVLEGWSGLAVVLLLQHLEKGSCDHCMIASIPQDDDSGYGLLVEATDLPTILSGVGFSADGATVAQAIGLLKSASAIHSGSVLES